MTSPTRRRVGKILACLAGGVVFFYTVVTADMAARSWSRYREGLSALDDYFQPHRVVQRADVDYLKSEGRLRRAGELHNSLEGQAVEMEILQARRERLLREFPLKKAYLAFQEVERAESPPLFSWGRRARLLAPAVRWMWEADLIKRGLPVNTELFWEEGEDDQHRTVYSTLDFQEALRAVSILKSRNIESQWVDSNLNRRAPGLGYRILVSPAAFWEAHGLLRTMFRLKTPSILVESLHASISPIKNS